ncbi:hypothetical protein SAMN05192539_105726 [Paraburkholderia diazotrophica]|uniref:Uncharacterized protein n=1 Tax=Paraburkholderia diazotrophica TaxID=667676 RepID=A0A1H7EJX2_9BURK|nr:hypothetical protein SAMN05192539_105726 [Paraburkholderia diazotrophica]
MLLWTDDPFYAYVRGIDTSVVRVPRSIQPPRTWRSGW